jgi:hypothetical protein
MKAGRLPPKVLARTLLRELAEEENRKALNGRGHIGPVPTKYFHC